jgi:hypothetical protein
MEILELTEQLRQECTPRFRQQTQSRQSGTTLGSRRSVSAIAHSYQRFLCFAFLVYLPPQRQQELRTVKVSCSSVDKVVPSKCPMAQADSWLYRDEEQWWLKLVDRQHNPSALLASA